MKGFGLFHSFVKKNHDLVLRVAGGWRHTMAVPKDGKLYGWGWNKVIAT
jgi:alpha-tubulin suppressor-like RCC1 family protein